MSGRNYITTVPNYFTTQLKAKIEKHPGYSMSWWKRYSLLSRQQDPVCNNCKELFNANQLIRDHIIPVTLDGSFEDKRNHQNLCQSCHSKKTKKEKTKPMYQFTTLENGKKIPVLDIDNNLIERI